jgi:hypothetical protein
VGRGREKGRDRKISFAMNNSRRDCESERERGVARRRREVYGRECGAIEFGELGEGSPWVKPG